MTAPLPLLPLLLACGVLTGCQISGGEGSETSPVGPSVLSDAALREAEEHPVDFKKHIQPILAANCAHCHDGKVMPALVDLTNRRSVMTPGPYGPRLVPGRPDQSLLVSNLSRTHAPVTSMPPVGSRLTPRETRILRKWIKEGALWPAS
jgi:hypothetical protein